MIHTQKVQRDHAIEQLKWCRKEIQSYTSYPADYIKQNESLNNLGLFDLIGEEVFILLDLERETFLSVIDAERMDLTSALEKHDDRS